MTRRVVVRELEDIHLVRAAQTGDLPAFGDLVRRYELRVYRTALRMLGNPTEAEDAAQDAFVQAWQALPTFRKDSSVSTWLYRIVTNRCLNLLQARRELEVLPATEVAAVGGVEQTVETNAMLVALRTAIERMTPEQRVTFVLREFEGLRYDEIAEVLDVSVSSVKGRLNRARIELIVAMKAWL